MPRKKASAEDKARSGKLSLEARQRNAEAGTHDYTEEVHVGADYTDEQREWLKAMDALHQRVKFPTYCQILEEAHRLGYRKDAGCGKHGSRA